MNGSWNTRLGYRDQNAPKLYHPTEGKQALLHVTKLGVLSLLYQQEYVRWLAVSKELEHVDSSSELLTHASFCQYVHRSPFYVL